MAITALNKVAAKTANEICVRYPLEDPARQLLRDNLSPPQFLEALITSQLQPDAVKFLAQALPKRESIWWACEGVKSAAKPEPHSKAAAALDAAASTLAALGPWATLDRGYAVVRGPGGAIVRDAATLSVAEAIEVRLARGVVDARVEAVRDSGA